MKNVFPVSTRLKKNGPKITTMVTVDYAGVNTGDGKLIPDAEKSMVITAQNQWRRAGKIPQTATIMVATFAGGHRTANVEPAAVIAGLSDAEFNKMVARETAKRAKPAKPGKPETATEKPAQNDGGSANA